MSKSIIITGGSRGIGAAVARLCGSRGWSVAISYAENGDAAEATVAAVKPAGGKAFAHNGHVADEADVLALFDAAASAFGGIDGVVNNAGVLAPATPLAEISLERLRAHLRRERARRYLVAREAARRMSTSRGGRGGSLINLSSAAAKLGAPGEYVDYAGSKGAVEAMTLGLSKELGRDGIRVNAVRPGLIETDIQASGGDPGRAAAPRPDDADGPARDRPTKSPRRSSGSSPTRPPMSAAPSSM